MASEISAVVVRWKGDVSRCLQALEQHGQGTEVVLVDSGSGDGQARLMAKQFPAVHLVELEDNVSFAHAANQGVLAARADLIFLLNPDTAITRGCTETLCDFLADHPDAAGAAPLLVEMDSDSCQSRWQLRRFPGVLRLGCGLPGAPLFRSPPSRPTPVPQPAAAAWMIRRQVWSDLDGLDPGFKPAWWEDVDFCRRLHLGIQRSGTGTGFWFVPDAVVRHQGGSSLEHLEQEAFLSAFYSNLLRYARRHHGRAFPLISSALRWSLRIRAWLQPARRRALHNVLACLGRAEGQNQE